MLCERPILQESRRLLQMLSSKSNMSAALQLFTHPKRLDMSSLFQYVMNVCCVATFCTPYVPDVSSAFQCVILLLPCCIHSYNPSALASVQMLCNASYMFAMLQSCIDSKRVGISIDALQYVILLQISIQAMRFGVSTDAFQCTIHVRHVAKLHAFQAAWHKLNISIV